MVPSFSRKIFKARFGANNSHIWQTNGLVVCQILRHEIVSHLPQNTHCVFFYVPSGRTHLQKVRNLLRRGLLVKQT